MTTTTTEKRGIRWVSPAEYAALYRISLRTVHRRLSLGQIPGVDQPAPGCAIRIPVRD